jgi:hypothetical protein
VPLTDVNPLNEDADRERLGLGEDETANVSALVSIPLLVLVTVITPVLAEAGTIALICVPPPCTLAVAGTPLNLTTGEDPKL